MQQIYYNDVALHDLGKVIITRQNLRGEPERAPQRWRRRVQVRLNFHQPDYASNHALVRQIEAVVRTQHATLKWVDSGTGSEWVSRPAELVEHDWPENPNAFGTYHQSLTLAWEYLDNLSPAEHRALAATFQRVGVGAPVIELGMVESFKVERQTRRFDPHRDNRNDVTGRISARGRVKCDPNQTLEDRRASMLSAIDQMQSEIGESTRGTLIYGSTNRVVRVESFVAELDQATWDIPWSISADFSAFPNEAGYAQAEFTVDTREEKATNSVLRTLAGRIAADSEAAALAKLSALRDSVLSGSTWTTISQNHTPENLDGEDGAAFIRLAFSEEFRRSIDSVVSSELEVSDSDDAESGMIRRVYAGRVTAAAATWESAYAAALARARSLGHRKFQFQTLADESMEDHRLASSGIPITVTSGSVLVHLKFRYEYRIKGSRLRISLTTRSQRDAFSQDTDAVSGQIVAVDQTAAATAYAGIKALYSTRLIRDENTSLSEERIGNLSGEVPLASQTALFTKLEFAFSTTRPKDSGVCSARYEMEVVQDFVARTKNTSVRGSIAADTAITAESWLVQLFNGMGLGSPTTRRRTGTHERGRNGASETVDTLTSMSFDETYVEVLSGDSAILACELSEQIECSGQRIAPQPTASGPDVIQVLPSVASGRRTISGTVVATDETTALAWAKRQRTLPLPSGVGTSGVRAEQPPRISFAPEWVPLVDGVARSGDYQDGGGNRTVNVRCVRCRFEFSDIMEQLTVL